MNPVIKRLPVTRTWLAILLLGAICIAGFRLYSIFSGAGHANLIDDRIFNAAANRFLVQGSLYERFDNNADGYSPGSAVYKFPPPYQLLLIPFLKAGLAGSELVLAKRIMYLAMYILACLLICRRCLQSMAVTSSSAKQLFVSLFIASTLLCQAFFNCLELIEPEIPVFLFLAIASYYMHEDNPVQGAAIAIGTWIKIYPAFLLTSLLLLRSKRALGGYILGIIVTGLISLLYFGYEENRFYLQKILPLIITEPATPNSQNLTMESWFSSFGILNTMDGTMTLVLKIVALLTILYSARLLFTTVHAPARLLFSSMCISAILLCANNYWLQYQVILLIPLCYILGYLVANKLYRLLACVMIFMLAANMDRLYTDYLTHILMRHISREEVSAFLQQYPERDPIWHFSPISFLLFRLSEIKFFYPAFLFFLSAGLLKSATLSRT